MVWMIVIMLIYVAGLGAGAYVIGNRQRAVGRLLAGNFETAKAEQEKKEEVLTEVAMLCLGLVDEVHYEKAAKELAEAREAIQSERGRITITEAELEAVDTRLRELEELKRELEVSNIDAIKELEMLRSQEREISNKAQAVRNQITDTADQIDLLLGMLASSAAAVERLTTAKNELLETDQRIGVYEEQITEINRKYMGLKRAYDALDIEYAQLYEKQQSALDDSN